MRNIFSLSSTTFSSCLLFIVFRSALFFFPTTSFHELTRSHLACSLLPQDRHLVHCQTKSTLSRRRRCRCDDVKLRAVLSFWNEYLSFMFYGSLNSRMELPGWFFIVCLVVELSKVCVREWKFSFSFRPDCLEPAGSTKNASRRCECTQNAYSCLNFPFSNSASAKALSESSFLLMAFN